MFKKVSAVVLVLALAVGGFFGYKWYGEQKFMEAITPHVKNASLRVINASQYELTKDTKITFKELFEKLDADVAEIDKRLLEVQTLENQDLKHRSEPVVAYLKTAQEYLRAQNAKYRKTLALSNSIDWVRSRIDDIRTSSTYGFDYALKASRKAREDMDKAQLEQKDSVRSFRLSAQKLLEERKKLEGTFPPDALVPVATLEAVMKANEDEPAKEEKKPTTEPTQASTSDPAAASAKKKESPKPVAKPKSGPSVADLAQSKGCLACHALDRKIVGPAYQSVARKYKGDSEAVERLTAKVLNGGSGVWGPIPMPPNKDLVSKEEVGKLVAWILAM